MTAVSSAPTSSPTRSRVKRYARRAVSGLLHLPPHTTDYTVHHGVRIPMRDGVELIADHYEPATSNPAGTLLVRGPYGRRYPFSALFAGTYASRGYHVVFQSVRGTFGSGGVFDPMVHEIADGADTAAWLREEPWFTGSFGTIGVSYLGFTQWALLTDPPPEMKAAVISRRPARPVRTSLGRGHIRAQRLPRLERHGRPPGRSWQDPRARQTTAGQTPVGARDGRGACR